MIADKHDSVTEPELEDVRESKRRRRILGRKIPWGVWLVEKLGLCNCCPRASYMMSVYFLTYFCYSTYAISRKSFSVVKVVLCPQCAGEGGYNTNSNFSNETLGNFSNETFNSDLYQNYTGDGGSGHLPYWNTGWPPYNGHNGRTLLGTTDFCFVFAYSIAMFISGVIADRVNLRYFLTIGCCGSGIAVMLLGVAYFAEIHHLAYFIVAQLCAGAIQSTGSVGTVAVLGHWFGIQKRGLLMGIWATQTAVGSILGTIIPSFWATTTTPNPPWGWSFFVPGFISIGMGIIVFFFLVIAPEHVGLPPTVHHLEDKKKVVSACNPMATKDGVQTIGKEGGWSKEMEEWEEQKIAELTRSPTSTRHKIWSFTPTQSPVLARKSNTDSHLVNGMVANGCVPVHLEGEEGDGGGSTPEKPQQPKKRAVGFFKAFLIPGVIEYSLALFFNKLVVFTFLYWLPFYVKASYTNVLSGEEADWLSTLFDVGSLIGAIVTGLVSDILDARAATCMVMLLLAVPFLFLLNFFGGVNLAAFSVLLIACGACINGPYQIITTAVSTDLGTHKSLKDNRNAKGTVAAIINGTGSMGAAIGPLIIGWLTDNYSWTSAFYFLMSCCFISAILLSRLVVIESMRCVRKFRSRWLNQEATDL